jgi:hypothetical protein
VRVVGRAVLACLVAGVASLVIPADVGAADSIRATAAAVLDCRNPIGAADTPRRDVTPIGGAVALQTAATTPAALQTDAIPDPSVPSHHFWAKSPLFVRAGRTARIVVPRDQAGRVAVTWGNTDHDGIASRDFSVGHCPSASKWIVFPGGFFVAEPACIDLVVHADGEATRVRVGVGAACRGQRPPPEPSAS